MISYSQIRYDAFRLTEDDARSGVPPVHVTIKDIDRHTLRTWRRTWAGHHPSGYGGFDWESIWYRACRWRPASFHAALWSREVLCALSVATIPRDRSRLTIHYMEGMPNGPHPLQGNVTGIVAAAAEYYARGLDLPMLEIEDPAPGLVARYQMHGFTLAFTRGARHSLGKPL